MSPNPPPEEIAASVALAEWERKTPADTAQLEGTSLRNNSSAQRIAESLHRLGRLDIREGYQGLEIATTSFVGRLDVGPLRIAIQPKLPAMPLATLLRYAYGLRDLSTIDKTRIPTIQYGLHDLLIEMLANEVEELLSRGLARRYISVSEKLDSPRGKILVGELARRGGITEARLPCEHFDRSANWHLNQVLRAGLGVATQMTEERELRRRVHRLSSAFGTVDHAKRLEIGDIDRAERALTRLTLANAAALTIVHLLKNMQGVTFEPVGESIPTSGFLFDMNSFFQQLLLRFLREHLSVKSIVGEHSIREIFAYSPHANPRGRSAPRPRPDYALFHANKLYGFLDAKYRDIWERGLPSDWLYQLSMYALASPLQVSILLYATTSVQAQDERIEIHQPVAWSGKAPASVILRPVLLPRLAELLHPDQSRGFASERRRFADELVVMNTHTQAAKQKVA